MGSIQASCNALMLSAFVNLPKMENALIHAAFKVLVSWEHVIAIMDTLEKIAP